jgi:hypothetical protein
MPTKADKPAVLSSMVRPLHVIERAYQLADSGECKNLTEIRARLHHEGYPHTPGHLDGFAIRKSLADRCKAARKRQDGEN